VIDIVETVQQPPADRTPSDASRISRRAALQLGAGAGAAAVLSAHLARLDRVASGVDLGAVELTATQRPNWPAPRIVTRAQWGADESLRKRGVSYNPKVSKLVVHHTGTPNSVSDYAALARGIYTNEISNGYLDIAYNWLIDPRGRIYEGRWAKDYPRGDVHTGERDRENVMGAHALHFNESTIGIGLMGDYSSVAPSNAMLRSLVTLLSWKCARWGINPLGSSSYVNGEGRRVAGLANICGHRDTFATACPGATVEQMLPRLRTRVAARVAQGALGYWIATSTGQVFAFGNLPNLGGIAARRLRAPLLGICRRPTGDGYWLFAQDGGIFSFGDARFFGSTGGRRLDQPIVAMAPTPSGRGYWLVARDGGVFCFGDARFFGSTGGRRLRSPILGITPTSTGKGYWLFAQDGGIFAFGDAKFFGSTGGRRLDQPIVGMGARPQDDGYWMVARDGGIFGFGRAPFKGSGASQPRSASTVSITPSSTGNGYALLLADGSYLPFGDVPDLGGAKGRVSGAAIGMAGFLKPL
jgi:hypothetical protein